MLLPYSVESRTLARPTCPSGSPRTLGRFMAAGLLVHWATTSFTGGESSTAFTTYGPAMQLTTSGTICTLLFA